MPRIPGLRRIVRLATGRSRVDADIDDELAFHLDATAERLVREGMAPDLARHEAERRFGDVRATRERLRSIDGAARRELLLRERLGALALDLRMAARGLRRSPALALAVVLTLALGLGANATMFGIVDRLLLRPPAHVVEPERAARVWYRRPLDGGTMFTGSGMGYGSFDAMRQRSPSLSHVAASAVDERSVGRGEALRQLRVGEVTGDFFALLGARPLLGRFLGPADDTPAAAPAVVLSWDSWQRDHGGAVTAVGQQLVIDGRQFTIVGVAPRGFAGAELQPVGAWITMSQAGYDTRLTPGWRTNHDWTWLSVLVRLAPGASPSRAEAELTAAFRSVMTGPQQHPTQRRSFSEARVLLGDLVEERGPEGTQEARVALWLAGVAVIVLLIACANVANLLLARAIQREREVAVQLALGAAPGRLARQFLAESALLALAGGAAALLVATLGGGAVARLLLPDIAWDRGPVDGRVLLATAAVIGLTALLITLSPVLQARRITVHDALRAGGRGSTGRLSRARGALTIAQAALSVLLLVGAGLFVRSLHRARGTDLGMDARRVLYASVDLGPLGWSRERMQDFWQRAQSRVGALPGVASASLATSAPFLSFWAQDVYYANGDSLPRDDDGWPAKNAVTPEHLRTMGTPILRGRDFTASDVAGSPRVAIVNDAMARFAWKGEDAIGKCIRLGADTAPCTEIVGIAANVRTERLAGAPPKGYYIPLAQGGPTRWLFLLVRASADDARPLIVPVRRALQGLDANLPFPEVEPIQSQVDPRLRPWTLGATLFTAFGVLALVVAAVGLYGVLAYDVAQRTRELGVRAALGARRADVVWLVMRRGLLVAATGIVLGVGASLLASRWIGSLLFEMSARDPLTFGVVAAVLLGVAAAASFVPAWRASRVSPQAALRAE